MKKTYPHLWGSLYGTPLMILPDKAVEIERVFQSYVLRSAEAPVKRMEEDERETPEQRAERKHAQRCTAYAGIAIERHDSKPYAITTSGIALIPVMGTLVQRGSFMSSMSGLTGYDQIASLIDAAERDPAVKGVLLEIDSKGGQANGVFETAARIVSAGAVKPVWGHANEMAYSAAYALLAATGRAYAPLTGGVGSIGTLALHVDQSKRDAMQGYSYTAIHAGAKKADMSPHAPLSASALEFLQGEVDRINAIFVSHVADARHISTDAVYAKEAGLMSPPEALDEGFIDGVATFAEVVTMLEAELRSPGLNTGTLPAARAQARATGMDQDAKSIRAAAVQAEHDRIQAILTHPEAKDRAQFAQCLALESDLDFETAVKLLAAAAKPAKGSTLASLMAGIKNPNVGIDADNDPSACKPRLNSAAIYALRRQAKEVI